MKQISTTAIILKRIDYGEADRIITLLTPDGRLSILAKGVRRSKSKMAGGLELFSTTNISYIDGRSELKTLISTQLITYYSQIVTNIERTMFGYDALGAMYKTTQHGSEEGQYALLEQVLKGLNDLNIAIDIVRVWFVLHYCHITGSAMNLEKPLNALQFSDIKKYEFHYDDMTFLEHDQGSYSPKDIKFLRFAAVCEAPDRLARVEGASEIASSLSGLMNHALKSHL